MFFYNINGKIKKSNLNFLEKSFMFADAFWRSCNCTLVTCQRSSDTLRAKGGQKDEISSWPVAAPSKQHEWLLIPLWVCTP